LGGALGVLAAHAGAASLIDLSARYLPRSGEVRLDFPVLAFALGVSLASGLVAGALPALRSQRTDLMSALRESGVNRAGTRLRELLATFPCAVTRGSRGRSPSTARRRRRPAASRWRRRTRSVPVTSPRWEFRSSPAATSPPTISRAARWSQ